MPDGNQDVHADTKNGLIQAQSAALTVDAYVALFSNWATPTAADQTKLAPYLPNYATHLQQAKSHASTWTDDVRPGILELLASIGSMYQSYVDPTTQATLRKDLRDATNAALTPEQRAAAHDDLVSILNQISSDASANLQLATSLAANMSTLSSQIAGDALLLNQDYQSTLAMRKDVTNLTDQLSSLQKQKTAATTEMGWEIAGEVLAGTMLVVGIVITVVVVVAAETVTAGLATPACGIAIGIAAGGAGGAAGLAGPLASASSRVNQLETDINALNKSLENENAALALAQGLSDHFAGFSGSVQALIAAVTTIATNMQALPEVIRPVRDGAVKAAYEQDYSELQGELAALTAQFQSMHTAVDILASSMATVTVQTVTTAPTSSVKVAA